jgi:hypothetical protein
MGNARGNAYWEANLPENYFRPADGDMAALRTFISDKYVHRRWAAKNFSEPPCIDNFQTHPVRVSVPYVLFARFRCRTHKKKKGNATLHATMDKSRKLQQFALW